MNIRDLAGTSAVAMGLLLVASSPSALADVDESKCAQVSGSMMTNFTAPTTTLGTSSGDLSGAVSVSILGVTAEPGGTQIYLVQHNLQTTAGDLIFFEQAQAVATPLTPGGTVFGITYDSVKIKGGTGKFDGARGELKLFGGADVAAGETVFRYRGRVCFSK